MRPEVYAALKKEPSSEKQSGGKPADEVLLRQFIANRDEGAFATLVRRHGPMVQGVCDRILGDAHRAEDAFQAVFLVLVRKSASIRKPELLANWLYGVACRIARKGRISVLRRETRERLAGKMPMQEQLLDLEWNEVKAVLDDELSQLPEKYRAPLVLCYLRGQTNAEAAAQLGWPLGSISDRLAQAREMLRKRLNRRGLTLSAGLLALLLSERAGSAAVSPVLVEVTIKTGMADASKGPATGLGIEGRPGTGQRIGWAQSGPFPENVLPCARHRFVGGDDVAPVGERRRDVIGVFGLWGRVESGRRLRRPEGKTGRTIRGKRKHVRRTMSLTFNSVIDGFSPGAAGP